MLSMPKRDWLLLRARLRVVASLSALPTVATCDIPEDVLRSEADLEHVPRPAASAEPALARSA
jgi:hypothetical protein